jgi:dTDP-4-amino-4,6-dideoxygalactose transaminase
MSIQSVSQIPFNDVSLQVAELRQEIDEAIARVLDHGHFILGPENEAFEQAFANYLGVECAVGVANGTDALELALMALGIGAGDEVICPALTAAPTALAVLATGAQPVFADIHLDTFALDPANLEACLSEKTRAIIPVHLYGLAANMPAILDFAQTYDLVVIEDVAQAHGAMIGQQKTGTMARIGCFSFYPTKNMGAYGDGGAVVTNDSDLALRVRQLRDLGQIGRFQHALAGRNSRLDEIQAAILQVKLRHLDTHNAARRERAEWYAELLGGLDELQLSFVPEGWRHVYHLYVVRSSRRDMLRDCLRQQGISTDVHYPKPLPQQPVFAHCRVARGGIPMAEKAVTEILSLPMYPQLSREQVEIVSKAVREFTVER